MRKPAAAAPRASKGGADARGPRAEAGAKTEAAEQDARAPAAEAGAEAEAVDDPAPEDGMPRLHQVIDGEDDDERIVHEPTDPSEPRCPSGDSSNEEEEEEATESHSKSQTFSARTSPQSSAAMSSGLLRSAAAPA